MASKKRSPIIFSCGSQLSTPGHVARSASTVGNVLIAEELLLLSIDDETGKNALLGSDKIAPALGGALLVELALMERIGVTPDSDGWRRRGRVTITSTTPTDDEELDTLMAVLERRERAKVKDLISQLSFKRITKGLRNRLLQRLAGAGVLSAQRSEIFRLRSWPHDRSRPGGRGALPAAGRAGGRTHSH
jgi:hypothetical protein